MDEIVSQVEVQGAAVHVVSAGPEGGPAVLLLHGAAFSSASWQELGTLAALAGSGLRVVAVDLPGFGRTPAGRAEPDGFLGELLDALDLQRPVVVAPSMSGRFVFPLLLAEPERFGGLVPVAPAGLDVYLPRLDECVVPALVVWGGDDQLFPAARADELAAAFTRAEVWVIEGGPHPAYLKDPAGFAARVAAFVRGPAAD